MNFSHSLEFLDFKDLSAVTSPVDLENVSQQIIEEKIKNDPVWIKENARRHHEVIGKIQEDRIIIPIRFGTIFKRKSNLKYILEEYYPRIKNLLFNLEGKEEWGVRANFKSKVLEEFVSKKHKLTNSHPQTSLDWYQQRKKQLLLNRYVEKELEIQAKEIFKKLKKYSEKYSFMDNLPDFSDKDIHPLFNLAFLVKEDKSPQLVKEVEDLNKNLLDRGITLDLTGPWPPYNFVNFFENNKDHEKGND